MLHDECIRIEAVLALDQAEDGVMILLEAIVVIWTYRASDAQETGLHECNLC